MKTRWFVVTQTDPTYKLLSSKPDPSLKDIESCICERLFSRNEYMIIDEAQNAFGVIHFWIRILKGNNNMILTMAAYKNSFCFMDDWGIRAVFGILVTIDKLLFSRAELADLAKQFAKNSLPGQTLLTPRVCEKIFTFTSGYPGLVTQAFTHITKEYAKSRPSESTDEHLFETYMGTNSYQFFDELIALAKSSGCFKPISFLVDFLCKKIIYCDDEAQITDELRRIVERVVKNCLFVMVFLQNMNDGYNIDVYMSNFGRLIKIPWYGKEREFDSTKLCRWFFEAMTQLGFVYANWDEFFFPNMLFGYYVMRDMCSKWPSSVTSFDKSLLASELDNRGLFVNELISCFPSGILKSLLSRFKDPHFDRLVYFSLNSLGFSQSSIHPQFSQNGNLKPYYIDLNVISLC